MRFSDLFLSIGMQYIEFAKPILDTFLCASKYILLNSTVHGMIITHDRAMICFLANNNIQAKCNLTLTKSIFNNVGVQYMMV